jgi:hypothetical protein
MGWFMSDIGVQRGAIEVLMLIIATDVIQLL